MGNSWALLLIVAPPALVALAVARDKRSGRGYGLGVLAVGTLVLTLWGFGAVLQATQLASASAAGGLDLEVAVVAIVYVASGVYVALALTVGAIVETVIARQWWWLGIVAIVSVVPAVIIFASPPELVPNMFATLGLPRGAVSLVALLPPALVTFVYAIVRSIRRPIPL